MKLITIFFTALLCILTSANAQSQQVIRVLEFCPAPGQFTNTLPDIDATMDKSWSRRWLHNPCSRPTYKEW